jgi:histidinol-phosphate phosphatase family protein
VLLDRDGTLIEDVPYNGDPGAVRPMPGARLALDRMRAAGLRLAVVSNQSGVARGHLTEADVERINTRVEELLGPFDAWLYCPHGPADRCPCRKPEPGMLLAAAQSLRVPPQCCVMVGDVGADVRAGLAAGAAAVLVPTPVTLPHEVADARLVLPDLAAVADWVLARCAHSPPWRSGPRVLAVRSDSAGDVLITGPAIRALADRASWLTLLCGPRGRSAAELLPGVDDLVEWCVPWIDPDPPPVLGTEIDALLKALTSPGYDEAVIFTSFHQSPLPAALLLRLAGIPRISAISVDYPGSLLDVRHRMPDGAALPEPERALSLAEAAGFPLPEWDDGRLRLRPDLPSVPEADGDYVVVHPGASVPARACPPDVCREIVAALVTEGYRVLVTGGPDERSLTGYVAAAGGTDLGGRTSLGELASVVAGAVALVVGNTGPAHLAAATGTPVVSLFAPTVPYQQWGPYRVPAVRLGDQDALCRDTRASTCPVPGHPCLSTVDPAEVLAAVRELVEAPCVS